MSNKKKAKPVPIVSYYYSLIDPNQGIDPINLKLKGMSVGVPFYPNVCGCFNTSFTCSRCFGEAQPETQEIDWDYVNGTGIHSDSDCEIIAEFCAKGAIGECKRGCNDNGKLPPKTV